MVLTGGGDRKIIGWSVSDQSKLVVLEGHADWVRCMAFCKQGKLWSGGDDKTVKIWPLLTDREDMEESVVAEKSMKVHRGSVLCLVSVGEEMWSGGADRQISRFDLSGLELEPLSSHTGRVTSMTCTENYVWTGASDKKCIVWSKKNHRLLKQMDDFSGSVGSIGAMDGWCIWTGTGDGVMRCWVSEVPPDDAVVPGGLPSIPPVEEEEEEERKELDFSKIVVISEENEDDSSSDESVMRRERRKRRDKKEEVKVATPSRPSSRPNSARPSSSRTSIPLLGSPISKKKSSFVDLTPREETKTIRHHHPEPERSNSNHNTQPQLHQQQYSPSQASFPSHSQAQAQQPQLQQPPQPYSAAYQPYQPSFMQPQPQPQPSFVQQPTFALQPQPSYFQPANSFASPASPVVHINTSQSADQNGSFVSHLRESHHLLRNSYSTLSEKHELIREQHHRQMVQAEERHRKEMEILRKELELQYERQIREANMKIEALSSECQRLRSECEMVRSRMMQQSNVNSSSFYNPPRISYNSSSSRSTLEEMKAMNNELRKKMKQYL